MGLVRGFQMRNQHRVVMTEHLALKSPATLGEFCNRFRELFNLPEFYFDCENETEWGAVEVDNIEYNVSRPYEVGTLQEWDDTVPFGCSFGVTLIFFCEHLNGKDHDWAVTNVVSPIAQLIANQFATPVHYHRTWFKPGKNIKRTQVFRPKGVRSH